ncbi:MAG: ATP-dependent DNA helicase RecG [Chloroflexota bacterium]|nr:ATP-dependent DNA helicase RecG [Chloroflexota bacterium]
MDTTLGASGLPGASVLRRVGPRLGLRTVGDLLFHLPRRYQDLREVLTAAELVAQEEGEVVTARLEVVSLRVEQTFRRRLQRTVAVLRDETGEVEATWFGRRFIERRLKEGQWIVLSGRVKQRGFSVSLDNPDFQPDDGSDLLHVGRIVPIYRLTGGLSARTLRAAIRGALDGYGPYREYLGSLAAQQGLMGIGEAVEAAHFPEGFDGRDRALARLAFDELLALQVGMVSRHRQRQSVLGDPIKVRQKRLDEAVGVIETVIDRAVRERRGPVGATEREAIGPVRLTEDQRSALEAIRADLGSERPMLRLLQGDVGSGKTAVAALTLAFAADGGHQGALLAPTDLLARQHAATLAGLLEPLGHGVTLLSGSMPAAQRRNALELVRSPLERSTAGVSLGRVVVGTHALVQESVTFADLRLAVVDEQHRFGVAQREALTAKGSSPHVLLMTATPIPRTLGQILHADLDVSDLRTTPLGRQRIITGVRRPEELLRFGDRPGALALLAGQVSAGHRAFVIVPLVDESEESEATSVEGAARLVSEAWREATTLAGAEGSPLRMEIVHGQMRAAERDERMERFRSGETSLLVGTTVLEVGVDVPEATVMLILDADRFGMAQLHQLRGRVGRGEAQAYCILVSALYPPRKLPEERLTDDQRVVRARLDALQEHLDGFVLAELDFTLRREGELLGLQQSGLPPLRVASLADPRHRELSLGARQVAEGIVDAAGRLGAGQEALAAELATGWLQRVGAGEVLGVPGQDAGTGLAGG